MVLRGEGDRRPERIGAFTGLYYTATQSAAIFGPVAVGRMFDVTAKFTADGAPNYIGRCLYSARFALSLR